MIEKLCIIFAFLGLAFSPLTALADDIEPLAETRLLTGSLSPVVEIYVKGEGPYQFLLDTGANISFITCKFLEDYPDKLAMRGQTAIQSAGGAAFLPNYRIRDITIGDFEVPSFEGPVIDNKRCNFGIHGILGTKQLSNAVIDIDWTEKQIRVWPKKHIPDLGEKIVDEIKFNKKLNARFEAGGERFDALLDTGASYITMTENLAEDLGVISLGDDATGIISDAFGRAIDWDYVILPELRHDDLVWTNLEAGIMHARKGQRQMVIGASFMRRYDRAIFDFKGRRLYLVGDATNPLRQDADSGAPETP